MFNFLHKTSDSRLARLLLVGFGLVLAVLYDIFFWKQEMGIGFLVYTFIYLLGFIVFIFWFGQLRQKWAFLLLIPVLLQALSISLYNNVFVQESLPVIATALLLVFSLFLPLHNPQKFRFSLLRIPLVHRSSIFLAKIRSIFSDIFASRTERGEELIKKVGIGVLIALPLLLIFSSLLSNADAIFDQWLKNIFNVDIQWNWMWRTVRTFVLTLIFGGFFYVVTGPEHALEFKVRSIKKFDTIIVSVVLGLVSLLFLAFVIIQIKYLFGSREFVFESGLTFAEYARAGFFQLVWVVALSALMMLVVYRSFSAHQPSKLVTLLQIFLILQVGVIAASALRRMNLYQAEFGFTVLRLYVEWFIYFVLIVLLGTGVSIIMRIQFWKFFYGSLVAGVVAVTVVGLLNVDKMIATENVRRFTEQKKSIDLVYLKNLSIDIFPVLAPLYQKPTLTTFSTTDQMVLLKIYDETQKHLAQKDTWPEYKLSNKNIALALEKIDSQFLQIVRSTYQDFEKKFFSLRAQTEVSCISTANYDVAFKLQYFSSRSYCQREKIGNKSYLIMLTKPKEEEKRVLLFVYEFQNDSSVISRPIFEYSFSTNPNNDVAAGLYASNNYFDCANLRLKHCSLYDTRENREEFGVLKGGKILQVNFKEKKFIEHSLLFEEGTFRLVSKEI